MSAASYDPFSGCAGKDECCVLLLRTSATATGHEVPRSSLFLMLYFSYFCCFVPLRFFLSAPPECGSRGGEEREKIKQGCPFSIL